MLHGMSKKKSALKVKQEVKSPVDVLPVRLMNLSDLKPHPRNYRSHPNDQLEHIIASIKSNGMYRNVVIAKDNTVLAGHGVVEAVRRMGETMIPVVQVDYEPNSAEALKLLTGDNEISKLGEIDDRLLTDMLKEISDTDINALLGTGLDKSMLAALAMVSRPASEIKDFDAAAEWVGMPEYESDGVPHSKLILYFETADARQKYIDTNKIICEEKRTGYWLARLPYKKRNDTKSVAFKNATKK